MDYSKYIDESKRKNVMPSIIECLDSGKSVDQTAKKLVEIFGFEKELAKTFAWTELARVQTHRAIESYLENGIPAVQFSASPNCCPICQALDGKIIPIEKSYGLELPHTRCTCCWLPHWP